MPFIPHTKKDIEEMLSVIGVNKIEDLFDEIPASLRHASLDNVPPGMTELELNQAMRARADLDDHMICFIGAGAYEHHIPAAVWEVATRGEFMTSYTPYQAEASQGTLQLIYEFQTMMASLMSMEVSNASLYDGASALGEAVLMAARLQSKKTQPIVLMPRSIHPNYRKTVHTIVKQLDITIKEIPYDATTGKIDIRKLEAAMSDQVIALIIPQPNFFGVLEDVDALTDFASTKNILSIGVVNPMAMALLKPPGQWGQHGVDIACGEGQPLGIPLAGGGPYYGFLCTKKTHVRQMPGRIVGRTLDVNGNPGYVLTLQAREQHIRRAKATSNICTNQGLMVIASTIYMSIMGPTGLRNTAIASHERTTEMVNELTSIPGVQRVFSSTFFHEVVLRLDQPVAPMLHEMAKRHFQAGFSLKHDYPELGECFVICATETKSKNDIKQLADHLRDVLAGKKVSCLV